MPRVFEFVQKQMMVKRQTMGRPIIHTYNSCNRVDLGRVFHIMKEWKMPSLFSYAGSDGSRFGKDVQRKRERMNHIHEEAGWVT